MEISRSHLKDQDGYSAGFMQIIIVTTPYQVLPIDLRLLYMCSFNPPNNTLRKDSYFTDERYKAHLLNLNYMRTTRHGTIPHPHCPQILDNYAGRRTLENVLEVL